MHWDIYLNSHTPFAILPVLAFLSALVWFDSFKLVPLRLVMGMVLLGALGTIAAYVANSAVYNEYSGSFVSFSRYVSPFIEEAIKAIPVIVLVRLRRVGLLVDAAIVGFAVGTGFALIENFYYLANRESAVFFVQVIRGFGTAIMHGGATATFGVVTIVLQDRRMAFGRLVSLAALLVSAGVHSTYNHLLVQPMLATLVMSMLLPVLFVMLFRYSERSLREWMESGLSARLSLLREIRAGVFLDTPAGHYLKTLSHRFSGETLADMLCYLRLHGELALRAQGVLMMRETGWEDPPLDVDTLANLKELGHVERAIGRTGLLALHPLVGGSSKDLWQLTLLGHR